MIDSCCNDCFMIVELEMEMIVVIIWKLDFSGEWRERKLCIILYIGCLWLVF